MSPKKLLSLKCSLCYVPTDINECTQTPQPCTSDNSVCENTNGSYLCACQEGFRGDGKKSCSGIVYTF